MNLITGAIVSTWNLLKKISIKIKIDTTALLFKKKF